jgi:hypothetical protein
MYVLVLVAVIATGDKNNPVWPMTPPTTHTYQTLEACKLDAEVQVYQYWASIDEKLMGIGGKCVEVLGPAGDPS